MSMPEAKLWISPQPDVSTMACVHPPCGEKYTRQVAVPSFGRNPKAQVATKRISGMSRYRRDILCISFAFQESGKNAFLLKASSINGSISPLRRPVKIFPPNGTNGTRTDMGRGKCGIRSRPIFRLPITMLSCLSIGKSAVSQGIDLRPLAYVLSESLQCTGLKTKIRKGV